MQSEPLISLRERGLYEILVILQNENSSQILVAASLNIIQIMVNKIILDSK